MQALKGGIYDLAGTFQNVADHMMRRHNYNISGACEPGDPEALVIESFGGVYTLNPFCSFDDDTHNTNDGSKNCPAGRRTSFYPACSIHSLACMCHLPSMYCACV
jgi:hypothetical protein